MRVSVLPVQAEPLDRGPVECSGLSAFGSSGSGGVWGVIRGVVIKCAQDLLLL